MSEGDASRADICVVACAEAWRDAGEVMASPFGTVPSLGARLAKATFAPELALTDGEAALMVGTPPIGTPAEDVVVEAAMGYRAVFDVLWSGRRHIMMMASQIDRFGNQNLSAIGDWRRPKVQLVGVRGAPGNSLNHPTSYWVPDHSPRTFVEQVDVVCGVGTARARAAGSAATRFHHLGVVVSNLGVFDFDTPQGAMRVRSIHPGVSLETLRAETGFELVGADEAVPTTRRPSPEETELLATLDPTRLRDREVKE